MNIIKLKPGREKSIKRGHPWVYSGAIDIVQGEPVPGSTVEIQDTKGAFLAYGAYSPWSQIRIRAWSWDANERINRAFFLSQLQKAIEYRETLLSIRIGIIKLDGNSSLPTQKKIKIEQTKNNHLSNPPPTDLSPYAYRLIHAESDGIPGLIVDRYHDVLVVQFLSAGVEFHRKTILDLLQELTGVQQIYERSDVDVRLLEGLNKSVGPLRGNPKPFLMIEEHDLKFSVNIANGHKTGFYLDQKENRRIIRDCVYEADVLDCFCYSGGFLVNALYAGANSITAIDTSESALELAEENVSINDLPLENVEWICGDVFQHLRRFRDQGRSFDTIILDPPKFAPTAAHARKAARGYKDINLFALKLLKPGGTLMTFSCSGGISTDLFQKIVAGAALDAGVNPRIITHLEQSPDHPVALNFPEGAYLKGLLLRT